MPLDAGQGRARPSVVAGSEAIALWVVATVLSWGESRSSCSMTVMRLPRPPQHREVVGDTIAAELAHLFHAAGMFADPPVRPA
ncbi:hypothetical protein ACFQ9Q_23665 [Streptomyces virginiae]|uniref:hypothetical protein n=1 Tax=Streptomyces virginiae TaxID=1961 RepID=UPI00369A8C35